MRLLVLALVVGPVALLVLIRRPPLEFVAALAVLTLGTAVALEVMWRLMARRKRRGETFFGLPLDDPLEGTGWRKRLEIGRAVRRGEAVRDPRDAAPAAAAAAHHRRVFEAQAAKRWRAAHLASLAAAAVPIALFLLGEGPSWLLVLAVFGLLTGLAQRLLIRRQIAKAVEAERKNRELAALAAAPESREASVSRRS